MWVCDLGNTRIRWAWHEEGRLRDQGSALRRDAAWKAAWRPGPNPVAVVSVADDEAERALETWLLEQGATQVRFPRSRRRSGGVTNAYKDVSQLGADRWAALVAAHARHAGPLTVIDAGSAVSVDVLDRNGRHLGGAILPGLRMMRLGLIRATARIGADAEADGDDLGIDTAECVSVGVLSAVVGGVRRVLDRAERRLGAPPTHVLCGGDAPRLRRFLEPVVADPDLVLWGAALLG